MRNQLRLTRTVLIANAGESCPIAVSHSDKDLNRARRLTGWNVANGADTLKAPHGRLKG